MDNEFTTPAPFKFDDKWQEYVEAFVEFKEILGKRIDNYGSMNPLHKDLVWYMLYNWPGFHVLRLSRILRVESPAAVDKLNSALSDRQSLESFDLPRYGLKTANKHIQKEAVKEVYSLVKAFVDAFDEQYDLFCHEFRRVELNDDLRRLVKEAQQTGTRPAEDLKRLEDEACKTRVEIRRHAELIVRPGYESPFSKTEVTDIPSEANDMRRRNVNNLARTCKSFRKTIAEFDEEQERRRELHKRKKELAEKELKRLNEELSDSVELFRDAFREKFSYWFSTKSKAQKMEERESIKQRTLMHKRKYAKGK
ncbi:uncharacterized protein LAJ45_02586 [Morchella importuna]|uniref:uncharacterized protein n=1 Tax=Morchella importuna TaxID=1174673 RepID=UPI001E8D08C8|nr:uncharacterized protein LAJ45_02586 [Morchella importuna]KAH8152999.1 hypothetical protein LAJ45_02586 [Morchella importuna]